VAAEFFRLYYWLFYFCDKGILSPSGAMQCRAPLERWGGDCLNETFGMGMIFRIIKIIDAMAGDQT